MAAEIQGLEFIITSDIDEAVRTIDQLSGSLAGLKNATKGGVGLRTVANQLKALDAVLTTIDLSKFEIFASAFGKFSNANPKISKSFVNNLAGLGAALASISEADIAKLEQIGNALSKFPSELSLTGLGGLGKAVQQGMPTEQATATEVADPTVVEKSATSMTHLSSVAYEFGGVINSAANAFGRFALVGLKFAASIPAKVGAAFQAIGQKITGLFAAIKRVAFYRMIRSLMRMFTQGFQEGLKNLYAYSQAMGTQFASSMDRLATSALYLKNSLATMAAPLINALAPAIDFVADKLASLFNLIAQFIARLSGRSTYTAAKKVATTWQGAAEDATGGAKKAVDEFRRYVLGFDELNILGSDNKSGGSGGGGGGAGGLSGEDMFEEREIESGVSDFADAIRDAFERHDWQELGQTIGEKINEVIDNVPWAEAGKKVGSFVNALFTTTYWTLDTINFEEIGSGVAEFLNNALEEIDFETVGKTVTKGFTSLIDTITGFFGTLDWGLVGSSLSSFLQGVFDEAHDWIQAQDWEEFGSGLVDSARDFFEGAEGAEVVESLSRVIGSAVKGIALTVKGVGNNIWENMAEQARIEIEERGRDPQDLQGSMLRNTLLTAIENILNPGVGALQMIHYTLFPEDWFSTDHQSWQDWVEENIANPFMQGLTGDDEFSLSSRIQAGFEHIGEFFTQDKLQGFIEKIAGFFAELKKKLAYQLSRLVSWLQENTPQYLQNLLGMDSWSIDYLEGPNKADIHTNSSGKPNPLTLDVELQRDGWTTIDKFVGELSAKPFELGKSGWTTIDSYVGSISQRNFQLGKSGWTTIDKYVGDLSTKSFALGKSGWSTLDKYVGDIPAKGLKLYKDGWNSVNDFTGTKVDVGVQLYKSGWTDFKSFIGLKNGGIVTQNGAIKFFRSGGWMQGAKSGAFERYAGGTMHAGSAFIAGEAGPELVGHINNRSEVLNQSQIAQVMYQSTRDAMYSLGSLIGSQVAAAVSSPANERPVQVDLYLDSDRIATAVTKGQQAQNRRYSTTKL